MTCIMIGFTRAVHRLGTVYGNGTLTAADTGINAAGPNGGGSGDSTINFPATPGSGQIVTINNIGTGTVTVSGNGNNIGSGASVTLATGVTGTFLWDGYSWGVYYSDCSASVLNGTHDFGTTSQGPAETPYTVPANTVEYSGWWSNSCGETVRRVITTTYSGRSVIDQWKLVTNPFTGSNIVGTPLVSVNLGSVTTYGASQTETMNAAYAIMYPYAPSPVEWQSQTWTKQYAEADYPSITYTTGVSTAGIFTMSTGTATSGITLYYLDTHIVWTYEIV